MPGLSETSPVTLPTNAPGPTGGVVVIESPLPVGRSGRATGARHRAVPPVPPVGERDPQRPAPSQGRGTGLDRTGTQQQGEALGLRRGPGDGSAIGVRLGSSQLSSAFAAQLLGQQGSVDVDEELQGQPTEVHRTRGHEAYRRSGGEPPLFPDEPAVFSFAV